MIPPPMLGVEQKATSMRFRYTTGLTATEAAVLGETPLATTRFEDARLLLHAGTDDDRLRESAAKVGDEEVHVLTDLLTIGHVVSGHRRLRAAATITFSFMFSHVFASPDSAPVKSGVAVVVGCCSETDGGGGTFSLPTTSTSIRLSSASVVVVVVDDDDDDSWFSHDLVSDADESECGSD